MGTGRIFSTLVIFTFGSALRIENSGILPIHRGDILIFFYLTVVNDCEDSVHVEARGEHCCDALEPEDPTACEYMRLTGGHMGQFAAREKRNITLFYITPVPHGRRGRCDVELWFGRPGGDTKALNHRISFDTLIRHGECPSALAAGYYDASSVENCPTSDLDPLDGCEPVDCRMKYGGARPFFLRAQSRCVPAPECLTPEQAYDPADNTCRDLNAGLSEEDERVLRQPGGPPLDASANAPTPYVPLVRCHHGQPDPETGLCKCEEGWDFAPIDSLDALQPSTFVVHLCTERQECKSFLEVFGPPILLGVATALAVALLSVLAYLCWLRLCATRRTPTLLEAPICICSTYKDEDGRDNCGGAPLDMYEQDVPGGSYVRTSRLVYSSSQDPSARGSSKPNWPSGPSDSQRDQVGPLPSVYSTLVSLTAPDGDIDPTMSTSKAFGEGSINGSFYRYDSGRGTSGEIKDSTSFRSRSTRQDSRRGSSESRDQNFRDREMSLSGEGRSDFGPSRASSMRGESMRGSTIRGESMRGESMRGSTIREESMRGESMRGSTIREESMRGESMRGSTIREGSMRGESMRGDSFLRDSTFEDSRRGYSMPRDSSYESSMRGKSMSGELMSGEKDAYRGESIHGGSARGSLMSGESMIKESMPESSSHGSSTLRESMPGDSMRGESLLRDSTFEGSRRSMPRESTYGRSMSGDLTSSDRFQEGWNQRESMRNGSLRQNQNESRRRDSSYLETMPEEPYDVESETVDSTVMRGESMSVPPFSVVSKIINSAVRRGEIELNTSIGEGYSTRGNDQENQEQSRMATTVPSGWENGNQQRRGESEADYATASWSPLSSPGRASVDSSRRSDLDDPKRLSGLDSNNPQVWKVAVEQPNRRRTPCSSSRDSGPPSRCSTPCSPPPPPPCLDRSNSRQDKPGCSSTPYCVQDKDQPATPPCGYVQPCVVTSKSPTPPTHHFTFVGPGNMQGPVLCPPTCPTGKSSWQPFQGPPCPAAAAASCSDKRDAGQVLHPCAAYGPDGYGETVWYPAPAGGPINAPCRDVLRLPPHFAQQLDGSPLCTPSVCPGQPPPKCQGFIATEEEAERGLVGVSSYGDKAARQFRPAQQPPPTGKISRRSASPAPCDPRPCVPTCRSAQPLPPPSEVTVAAPAGPDSDQVVYLTVRTRSGSIPEATEMCSPVAEPPCRPNRGAMSVQLRQTRVLGQSDVCAQCPAKHALCPMEQPAICGERSAVQKPCVPVCAGKSSSRSSRSCVRDCPLWVATDDDEFWEQFMPRWRELRSDTDDSR